MSYREAKDVVPNDGVDLDSNASALYVGSTGHIAVHMVRQDDDAIPVVVVFNNVQAGTILPIWVRRVLATGTTALNIRALRS